MLIGFEKETRQGDIRTFPSRTAAFKHPEDVRAYFDTNVYSHIRSSGELSKARELLRSARWNLVASSHNLFEAFAAPEEIRREELRVLTKLANQFDEKPSAFRDASEVLAAVRKHRPTWLRAMGSHNRTRVFIREHVRRWWGAKAGHMPGGRDYAKYREVLEAGIREARSLRSNLRAVKLARETAYLRRTYGERSAIVHADVNNPQIFWRLVAWLSYDGAILQRYSQTRDLSDYLLPRLKTTTIDPEDFFLFWMRDVEAVDVPRTMWEGLVAFGQSEAKGSHGDPADQSHSAFALDVDVFVTADRRFHNALITAQQHYPFPTARFYTWDRARESALKVLQEIVVSASQAT
jgi:hypothetical protein